MGEVRPGGDRSRGTTAAVLAGAVAPAVFVTTFTVDGLLKDGYHPASMFVSELSIGSGGWVQQVNFSLTGLLIMIFAHGVRRVLATATGVGLTSITLAVLGLCLGLSGPVVTDPSASPIRATAHGTVHGLLGAVVFVCMPISAFAAASVFGRAGVRGGAWSRWTRVTGTALIALIVLLKIAQIPTTPLYDARGLIQRVVLIGFSSWLFSFALRLWRQRRSTV